MIPILYEKDETVFASNGLGRLRDCIRCEVTEERNGIYEVEFDYPINGQNYDRIECGRIIAVEHDDSDDIQPFDIYAYSKPIDGIVTFRARHISYRQGGYVVKSLSGATGITAAFALLGTAVPTNPFSYETDIDNSTSYMGAAAPAPISVRAILGGTEGSILDAFGGEYEWDKWTVRLHAARGEDRDLTVRYGVNMLDYLDETDYSGSYDSAIPYWTGSDDVGDVVVVGDKVSSGLPTYDGRETCAALDFSENYETKPTKAQLTALAKSYMASNKVNLPAQTITVSFVRLTDTPEYANFAPLQECGLCDTVRVEFSRYGMSGRFKVVKTVYDVLTERYTEMELGTLSTSLSEALGLDQGGSSNGVIATKSGTATKVGNHYSSGTINYYVRQGVVTVKFNGVVLSADLTARTVLATIPYEYRPPSEVYGRVNGTSTDVVVRANSTDQTCEICLNAITARTVYASLTYVVA